MTSQQPNQYDEIAALFRAMIDTQEVLGPPEYDWGTMNLDHLARQAQARANQELERVDLILNRYGAELPPIIREALKSRQHRLRAAHAGFAQAEFGFHEMKEPTDGRA